MIARIFFFQRILETAHHGDGLARDDRACELLRKVIDKTNYKYFSDRRSKDAFKRELYHVLAYRK